MSQFEYQRKIVVTGCGIRGEGGERVGIGRKLSLIKSGRRIGCVIQVERIRFIEVDIPLMVYR